MTLSLRRLAVAFSAACFTLAALLAWWSLYRAPALTGRLDNPRRSLREQTTPRGQITDRHGQALATSVGERGAYQRVYPVPEAAPVVGYNSPFYGQAGLEATLDPILTGQVGRDPARSWWENLLRGGPLTGYDAVLTLDAALQQAAASALGDVHGAVVLLDALTGEILVLVSSPTFDPTTLDQDWETLATDPGSPLFNRATQGQYPPGGALQPVILAAALQANLADLADVYPAGISTVQVNGQFAECAETYRPDRPPTLAEAFTLACPAPFADLGRALGPDALSAALDAFHLFDPPPLDLPTGAPGPLAISPAGVVVEAIGQGRLGVSPLRMALVTAALANRGQMPAPRLVARVQTAAGQEPPSPPGSPALLLSPEVAAEVAALMAQAADTETGAAAGMAEADVAGHFASALTGSGGIGLGWFTGFTPAARPRYALAIVLEDQPARLAATIGAHLLALIPVASDQ